jgi:uncharacterized protein involved in exopolysaccharide biosynthesis
MDQKTELAVYQDEITLRDVLAEVRLHKWSLSLLILAFAVGGVVIGLVSQKEYSASTVLSPVSDQQSGAAGSLSALASQYSGLASLAGIAVPGSKDKDEAIAALQSELLQSELLTESYIRQQKLLPILYPKLWDSEHNKWLTSDPQKTPTLWKANRLFVREIRTVMEDKKGLVVLTIRWKDPIQAAQWANELVKLTNLYLRNKAIEEAERNINYLNEQAAKTNVLEAQKAVYSLLESEINKEMIARGREEYALKVIDPAFVPERPSSPGAAVLGLLGLGLGCTVAVLIAFGRKAFST